MNPTLLEMKERFRHEIDSPRRFEQIKTIEQLLHVLEIRDLLSEANVQALKDIAQTNNSSPALNKIIEYEKYHVSSDYNIFYGPENTLSASQKKIFQNVSNNLFFNLSDRKLKWIHETLIKKIGTFWSVLARKLKIIEGEIDNIETSCVSLQSKAEKMFEIYIEKADNQKWLFVLCEALEKAHRKDLAKELQDILFMDI